MYRYLCSYMAVCIQFSLHLRVGFSDSEAHGRHACVFDKKLVSADGRFRLAGSSAVDVGRHVLSMYLHMGWALLAASPSAS